MASNNRLAGMALALMALLILLMQLPVFAQETLVPSAGKAHGLVLWTDPRTGQVFTRPGKGRVRLVLPYADLENEVERRMEERTKAAVRSEVDRSQEVMRAELKRSQEDARIAREQAEAMKPAWQEFGQRWFKKVKIGTLFYGDYAFYSHTGFGPQFLTQINPPGPGNDAYNSFDITRTYLNVFFSPTEDWTFRLTPNIYREVGNIAARNFGRVSAVGSTIDGNLGFRLKYAYLDYNKVFSWANPLKETKLTIGQLQNPLVDWEENLYGFRYVNLIPWNYLSLSSTQTGIAFHGPIKLGLGERQYVDYDFGVYTNASFHALEQSNTKQAMARVSLYPFGARSRFDGLGITGFYDYGYSNTAPDNVGIPFAAAKNGRVTRIAALLHYTAETWGLAGEFDWGHNAFTSGNLFSGSGPADESGVAPKGGTQFAAFDTLVRALQNNGRSEQRGFDFFGHYQIPNTPFTLFGMFQQFLPNVKADRNPVDFQRYVVGIEYKYNKYLRFALDTQNLMYYHDQFVFPASELAEFNPSAAAANPNGIKNPVPHDIHAFFLNVELNY